MNTWLPVLTVWLPEAGETHVAEVGRIDMPEPIVDDVLDELGIAAAAVLVDVFDEPQPVAAIADVSASTAKPSRRPRAPACMSYLRDTRESDPATIARVQGVCAGRRLTIGAITVAVGAAAALLVPPLRARDYRLAEARN